MEFSAKKLKGDALKLDVLKLNEPERQAYHRYQEALCDDENFNDMFEVKKVVAYNKGREESMQKGEVALLQWLLQPHFGDLLATIVTCIEQADASMLLRCVEKIINAKTLESM